MKKKRVTYGVYNLVELHTRLSLGKATVKVAFTGGSITALGVTPATHTTSDPIVQLAIENSPDFHSGKIRVVRSYPLEGEVEIERNPVQPVPMPLAVIDDTDPGNVSLPAEAPYIAIKENTLSGTIMPASVAAEEPTMTDETEAVASDEAVQPTTETEEAAADGITKVEVHCNDDAKDYLEAHFGVKRSTLLNRAIIQSTAAQYKVEFVFA